jgi:hypothetical protein
MTRPLRSPGITPVQRYYGAVRAWTAHRYFRPGGSPLVPFPLASPTRVSSSEQKPALESRLLHTGHRMDSKQVSSMPLPKLGHHPGFDVIFGFSMLHQRFACARLSNPHMTWLIPRLLTITFTTAAFGRSSLWQFEASSYKTAPKGPPSSLVQHDALASS